MSSYSKTLKKVILAVAILAAAGFIVTLNYTTVITERRTQAMQNITYFKEFTLSNLNGDSISEAALAGNKVTVINGWAPWCNPCTGEMPDLEKLSKEYEGTGLKIVGVVADYYQTTKGKNPKDYNNQIIQVISSTGVSYPVYVSDEAFYDSLYPTISGFPTTWAVNSDGEVLETVIGAQSEESWRQLFDKWLGEAE